MLLISDKDNRPGADSGDTDSGKGSSLVNSYGSSTSLNSSNSTLNTSVSTVTYPPGDSPEQFEVLKQTKDLWETGIDL